MIKRKKIFIFILLIFLIITFSIYSFLLYRGYIAEFFLKRESEPIIKKIEEFKEKNHHYPKSLSEIGYPEPGESGPIFYDLLDSNSYKVWFGTTLGESTVYESKTKSWK